MTNDIDPGLAQLALALGQKEEELRTANKAISLAHREIDRLNERIAILEKDLAARQSVFEGIFTYPSRSFGKPPPAEIERFFPKSWFGPVESDASSTVASSSPKRDSEYERMVAEKLKGGFERTSLEKAIGVRKTIN